MLLPGERYAWSDKAGRVSTPKERFGLPGGQWEWEDIWHVAKEGEVDEEGWEYSATFKGPFSREHRTFDYVRRRVWVRYCTRKR